MSRRSTIKGGGGSTAWPGTSSQLTSGAGGAVTVGTGLSLSGNTLTGGWSTALDVNLTAQSTQNFKTSGDGTYTIGGLSWSIAGTGNCTTFQVQNGSGMQIALSGNSTFASARIALATILAGLAVGDRDIRIWLRVTFTPGAGDAQFGCGLVDSTVTAYARTFICNNSSSKQLNVDNNMGSVLQSVSNVASISQSTDVAVLLLRGLRPTEHMHGIWSNGWPAPSALKTGGSLLSAGTNLSALGADPSAYLANIICTVGTGTAPTATFTHFRVDVR